MINTLNETSLHKSLKAIYRIQCNGKSEVKIGAYIADILCPDGGIIEIQTGTLGKLLKKTEFFLSEKRKIKIVYPLATVKYIETKDAATGKITRRKSPLKKNIYSVFKEITALIPILLEKNFTLEILFVKTTEIRTKTKIPEQSENKRRRFKKDWQKTDKKLNEITGTKIFSCTKDYMELIPKELPYEFCSKDIAEALKKDSTKPKNAANSANLIAWLFVRMNIFEHTETKNRRKFYKISEKQKN